MILRVIQAAFMNLRRDRAAWVFVFILPIVFFSIFAGMFSSVGKSDSMPKVRVAIADLDKSAFSARLVEALQNQPGLRVVLQRDAKTSAAPFDAAGVEAMVHNGNASVGLIIPPGFGESFSGRHRRLPIQLLADTSDPISPQMVDGILQQVAMTSMPEIAVGTGANYMDDMVGGFTPEQNARVQENMRMLQQQPTSSNGRSGGRAQQGMIPVAARNVLGQEKKNPVVAFYAAGIGVMFLLFSASSGGGVLLEESESGTLDRILTTRVSMMQLMLGKLGFLVLLGVLQLIVMFVWGAIAFHLELWSHIPGFLVMTVCTACATSAFGLLLASLSRTRAQLGALSTLLVLTMSALGGSMFPRFLMPETMQKIGLITFNAWAIDGYIKVFWRDAPISALWPQVVVLLSAAVVLFMIARQFSRRFETA